MCSETFLIPTCICLFDFNPNPNLRDSISFAYRFRILAEAGLKFEPKNKKVGHNFFYVRKITASKKQKIVVDIFFSQQNCRSNRQFQNNFAQNFLLSVLYKTTCDALNECILLIKVAQREKHDTKTRQIKTRQNKFIIHSLLTRSLYSVALGISQKAPFSSEVVHISQSYQRIERPDTEGIFALEQQQQLLYTQ